MKKIIVITGPTASGKTSLAVKLARLFDGEIVSADSRQVYRGMDIGTGKDLIDYQLSINNYQLGEPEIINIPYHLIDVAEPNDQFSLGDYQKLAYKAIDNILERGKLPIIVGGSGLYLQSVVDGYSLPEVKPNENLRERLEKLSLAELQAELKKANPVFYAKVNNSDINNARRLVRYIELASQIKPVEPNEEKSQAKYESLILGLTLPKEQIDGKIKKRLIERLEKENMVGEVEKLNSDGVSWLRLEKFGLEYRWLSRFLQNKISHEEMVEKLYNDICKFAKRQMTWFRRWEKQGAQIHWVNSFDEAKERVEKFLN